MASSQYSRKKVAEQFVEKNLPLVRAAEREVSGLANIAELMRNHAAFQEILTPGPQRKAWTTVSESKIVGLLRQLANEKNSEGFKAVLVRLLRLWGITPPPNAIARFKEVPGAPVKHETEAIRTCWEQDGQPKITSKLCLAYAAIFHASDLKSANTDTSRRNLIARIRTPLLNHQKQLRATVSPDGIRSAK
jgi:hypothetical protein